jgi:hypothetical protein
MDVVLLDGVMDGKRPVCAPLIVFVMLLASSVYKVLGQCS